ncbi:uncharacterized protein LOC111283610 [Durio zibethinus]|uniref:Uncharacterized protein LOC111283610 n=1 Tax=Durio zibethinus TaxID=66656 RepID=A0A6P5XI09_DURZI|nr:uncharacterized protein LOC111283610 [Durio zibethinus]
MIYTSLEEGFEMRGNGALSFFSPTVGIRHGYTCLSRRFSCRAVHVVTCFVAYAKWQVKLNYLYMLIVGLYMFSALCQHFFLSSHFVSSVEIRIASSPKVRPILVNGAVRKGDRLVPPSALGILMRITFPAPSARIKATERFEAIYPTLKEVALAGSSGRKATKQVAQQIQNYAVKAAGERKTKFL